jgi:hypothetical protein
LDPTRCARISARRTKVLVGGQRTKRKSLKVGMRCESTYPGNRGEAKVVSCAK